MTRIFSKKSSVKLPARDRVEEHEEWGRERGGVQVCPRCGNIHYQKAWHHASDVPRGHLREGERKTKICLACAMIRDHLFEGEIFLLNFPASHEQDLMNLVHAFGVRAEEKDPQDRIIKIEKDQGRYRITTTENQLAVKLAKKIREVFNAYDLKISRTREPAEVARIHVLFAEYKKQKRRF